MSWHAEISAHRFAVDGELAPVIKKALAAQAQSPGQGPSSRSIVVSQEAVVELLRGAPHDCDVHVALSGNRDEHGFGRVAIMVEFAPTKAKVEPETAAEAAAKHPERVGSVSVPGDPAVPAGAGVPGRHPHHG